MKIANKIPEAKKCPVRVTNEKYALYHMKPVLLGYIVKKDGFWHTVDGIKFVSSRAAIDYLSKLRASVETELSLDTKYVERLGRTGSEISDVLAPPMLLQKHTPVLTGRKILTPAVSSLEPESLDALLRSLGYVKREKHAE